jgi:hypothetical protein
MTREKYIIEVRDQDGKLDFGSEKLRRKEHPYLFSKPEFTIDELCYYASYGQQRNNPSGPMQLGQFMNQIGISYRVKTWNDTIFNVFWCP